MQGAITAIAIAGLHVCFILEKQASRQIEASVTIELDLQPDIEKGLRAKAEARSVSLLDYVNEIVVREAHIATEPLRPRTGQELVDVCAKVRGVLTDEEVGTLFSRAFSFARPIEFE